MHNKNTLNAAIYAIFRAFFTQSLAKSKINIILNIASPFFNSSGNLFITIQS